MPNIGLVLQCSQQYWQIANENDKFHKFWRNNVIDDAWQIEVLNTFNGRKILDVLDGRTHVISDIDWDWTPNSVFNERMVSYADWYLEVKFICHDK